MRAKTAPEVTIDLGTSKLYTQEELYNAMLAIKCQFASWAGCELHSIQYAGDEECTEENLEWLRSIGNGKEYKDIAAFLMDFHSPVEDGPYAWEPDTEYPDYQWWLAREDGKDFEIVSSGY